MAITAQGIEFMSASAHEGSDVLAEMHGNPFRDMKSEMYVIGHDDKFISSDVGMNVVEGDYMDSDFLAERSDI